ncbi:transposase [Paenibacillus sp. R14(2021)]|uniref:transposase n=1 Tax=Paenibacillus sp. R14(2021) TaxID=2859228 RepID=UPI001C6167C2
MARTSAPWRDLPDYNGSWKTVYTRFRRWQLSGVWEQILEQVSAEPDFENVMIGATIVRVHQHGAGAKGGSI